MTILAKGRTRYSAGATAMEITDELDRLTSASTTAAGTGQYSHSYAYDSIGNITSYAGNSYTYGGSKPHAVTAAYGNSYGYGQRR